MQKITLSMVVACLLFAGLAASATTIDNSADAVGPTYGWTAVGQTLTSPGGNLTSYSFFLAGPVPDITFYVCSGDVQNGCGGPLYVKDILGSGAGEVTVSGLNIPTIAGDTYSILMDLNGYGGDSVLWGPGLYPGGTGEWGYGATVKACC